ncbi:uncharacterized protein LOC143027475 [Oratosquilla oratoria]|uniref:uncharacterized protein LOC143027475 n=1 Tax=Oratosquilla oratoria TaxID=337810 RepID=UPI003F76055B
MTLLAGKVLCIFTLMAFVGSAVPQASLVGVALCAPCVAALGAAALGLAALGGLAARRRGGRRRGGGRRFGGHRGFRRRHGRSIEDLEDDLLKSDTMESILLKDDTGCARRLVCELKGQDPQSLSEWEYLILNFVGSPEDVTPEDKGEAWQQFLQAEYLGSVLHGNCAQAFPSCPYDANTIMGTISKMTTT